MMDHRRWSHNLPIYWRAVTPNWYWTHTHKNSASKVAKLQSLHPADCWWILRLHTTNFLWETFFNNFTCSVLIKKKRAKMEKTEIDESWTNRKLRQQKTEQEHCCFEKEPIEFNVWTRNNIMATFDDKKSHHLRS